MSEKRKSTLLRWTFFTAVVLGVAVTSAFLHERTIYHDGEQVIGDAINNFHVKNKRWPSSLDELELNSGITKQFRYETNAFGGYTLEFKGLFGKLGTTIQSYSPLNVPR